MWLTTCLLALFMLPNYDIYGIVLYGKKVIYMYLIVGLGNPEKDYSNTRHNMGFDVINKISEITGIKVLKKKFNALYGMGEINGNKVILVKPQTFMNLSGESVIEFKRFYKISNKNIIVNR